MTTHFICHGVFFIYDNINSTWLQVLSTPWISSFNIIYCIGQMITSLVIFPPLLFNEYFMHQRVKSKELLSTRALDLSVFSSRCVHREKVPFSKAAYSSYQMNVNVTVPCKKIIWIVLLWGLCSPAKCLHPYLHRMILCPNSQHCSFTYHIL